MSSDEQYEGWSGRCNGWSNRETWAVARHINDDQGWRESVHEELRKGILARAAGEPNAYVAGEIIRENVDEVIHGYSHGDADSYDEIINVLTDIGSLWRVDWAELGASFLDALRDEHPSDCRFCAAGEPMRHNYEPSLDES